MSINFFLFVSVVTLIGTAESYYTCATVDFCTNLRGRSPSDDYSVDSSTIRYDFNAASFELESNDGPRLVVTVTGLQQNTFRLQIKEVDFSRYELQDVLDGEPQGAKFVAQGGDDNSFAMYTDEGNSATVDFSPFRMTFAKNDTTEIIFEGNRLFFSQNDVNAPFTFGVTFSESVQLFGLHEHSDSLALETTGPDGPDPYRLKNLDVPGYAINSTESLYGAVPVLYGHSPSSTSGVFLHNAAQQWIETTNGDSSSAYFMVETGSLDLFVLLGPTPGDVVRQYTTLTGVAHMPQLWTLGYHQSRWSYDTQEDVEGVAAGFDDNNYPLDAIWLDIDYTDGFKYFTWNPETFPDPIGLQKTLASTNKKLVTIIDPHIKVETGYKVYDEALAKDLFVKNADGSVFQGDCWPGLSSYMDFLNPAAREFYGSMFSYDNFESATETIGGIWNDMNEPSVFDSSTEGTLPQDSLHMGNITHKEIHNIYGLLHTMATHQGLLARDNGERRPFVLTRSHFAGSQRYTAFWGGDNKSEWPYLLASFQVCLNSNILGIVFCGADVGGFISNPDDALFERWYLAGAWLPFYRAHSTKGSERREPYLRPEDTQAIIHDAIQTRYQHIPVWYTLFYEHTSTGAPVIRPIFYQYPKETDGYKIDNQLLVGSDILVRAITEPDVDNADVYFPGGDNENWIGFNNDEVHAGSGFVNVPLTREKIPVYYRQGAIIIRKDTVRLNTAEMAEDPYTLHYTPYENGTAHGMVYLDDGQSFKYRDDSDYNYITVDVNGDIITWSTIDGNGDYQLVVEKVVRRDIVKQPEGGRPGTFKETIFTTDANGVPLKDLRIGAKEKAILRLK